MFDFLKKITSLEEEINALKEVVYSEKNRTTFRKKRTKLVDSLYATEHLEHRGDCSLTRIDKVALDLTAQYVLRIPVDHRFSSASIIKVLNRLEIAGVTIGNDNHIFVYDSFIPSISEEISSNIQKYVSQR